MSTKSETRSCGIGSGGLLFLLFLTLKLTNVIDWSWWWVTAPLWGVFAVIVLVMLIVAIGAAIVAIFSK
jgi:hypothetical protein